jgi:glycyl-tRNA synthetase beta chain
VSGVPFLLEIGSEEIPNWMIPKALEVLKKDFEELVMNRLGEEPKTVEVYATPRRLVLIARNLRLAMADLDDMMPGPPVSAGEEARASFEKKFKDWGQSLQIVVRPGKKGDYYYAKFTKRGKTAQQIIAETLPALINIPWPKSMYWTVLDRDRHVDRKSEIRWIRPIRWLIAMLGDEVVPFEIAGVRSGNLTEGHRLLGCKSIAVTVANLDQQLEANHVLLSAEKRRAKIITEIGALLSGGPFELNFDRELLETLVYTTEFPTPILGSFDREYLRLPREVLSTVMRHHQNYFSLLDKKTLDLAPNFIAVMNTNADPEGLVRHGNERVLRARFNDARFFWEVDQKKKLADRVGDLAHVTFQAKVGSYLDKIERMGALADSLGGGPNSRRAVLLCKCDLTTEMVKEFTDLQGIVGGLYAKEQGEPKRVWQAIYEHYKPLGNEDTIPSTIEGQIVALADKFDTLAQCFMVGLAPTGSRDPFALRRAAQGVVRILVEGEVRVHIKDYLYTLPELEQFFKERVEHYFREGRGFRYDEVRAVLGAGWDDLHDVSLRLDALQTVRLMENFEPLASSFKRIANILKQASFSDAGTVDESLFEPGPERDLYMDFDRVRQNAKTSDYLPALEAIATLRPAVDRFFDKVLVNAPDERIRRNRLTLLSNLLTEFSAIADFSEIVPSST